MATIIGKLAVVVSANTASAVSGLATAGKAVAAFSTAVATIGGAAVVGGLAAAGAGITAIATNAFNAVDAAGDLAEKLGVGVEALSALQHAATMTDVDVESLNSGLGLFIKTMGKAGKSTDDLLSSFADVADQVARTDGIVEQGKIAFDNFGKGGLSLLPLLRKGRSGIEELAKEAKELGVAFNAVDVAKIGEADNAIKRMKAAVKGVGVAFASAFAPIVEMAARFGTNLMKSIRPFIEAIADQLQPAIDRLTGSLKDFNATDLLNAITPAVLTIGTMIDGVISSIHKAVGDFIPPMLSGLGDMVDAIAAVVKSFQNVENQMLRVWALGVQMNPASGLADRARADLVLAQAAVESALTMQPTLVGNALRDQAKKTALASLWSSMGTPIGDMLGKLLDGVKARISGWRPGEIYGPFAEKEMAVSQTGGIGKLKFFAAAALADAKARKEAQDQGPSGQLGDALVKGSKEAVSFVNRFRAGGDDKQEKLLDSNIRQERWLDALEKHFASVKEHLEDEADV